MPQLANGNSPCFYSLRCQCTLASSALEGITRDAILRIGKDMDMDVVEREITRSELIISDEIFLTGTAAEITPVGNILDNNFEVCDLIKNLSSSYEELVGKN